MPDIDEFASLLLEEAKRFLEKGNANNNSEAETANLHAGLMLAFSSLEAHVNSVADEVAVREGLSAHDRGILLEREVNLKDGEFIVSTKLKIYRLEDRIAVLHRLATGHSASGTWQPNLANATDLRNKLTHPKQVPNISLNAVTRAMEAVIETIEAMYLAVYKRPFPAAGRGLESKLDF